MAEDEAKTPAKAPRKPAAKAVGKTPAKAASETPPKTAAKTAAKTPAKTPHKTAGAPEQAQPELAAKPATAANAPVRPKKPTVRVAARAVKPADESPLQVKVYSSAGEPAGDLRLPEEIFGETPNQAVMHQAYVRQLANARQGTAATKTRGMVRGGGAKPYRQKGTGRARHGSIREPSMVGGGTVFGPKPRSFALKMPRKMRRLALRSALSVKANEGKVSVIQGFDIEEPRTGAMVELFEAVGVEDTALVVLATANEVVARSVSNLPWAKAILAHNLNLYDLFTHERLLIALDALDVLQETFSGPAKPRARATARKAS